MDVVTSAQMKQIEENSLAYDLTFHRLMENAGSAAAAFIRRTFPVEGRRCVIFCAKGSNGGDGYVVARKLTENGADVTVAVLDGVPEGEVALSMYNTVTLMEIPLLDFAAEQEELLDALEGCDIVVDAICGTGCKGSLRPLHRDACVLINSAVAAVVALDIPTGVECDTGLADTDAVRADFTVAFDSRKPAHVLPVGAVFCGEVEVVDIGIPPEAKKDISSQFGSLDMDFLLRALPPRPDFSHKGTFGRLLLVAGCGRYRGAAVLAATAALRAGVGLVTLASTETVCANLAAHLPEAVLRPLPTDGDGFIDAEGAIPALEEELQKSDAVVFGCGLGDTPDTALLLQWLLGAARCPVLVDADGINALAKHIHLLLSVQAPVVLTPHAGEMGRLLGLTAGEVNAARQKHAMAFSDRHKVTLVLKGPGTLVADAGAGLLVNTTGNAGLAKGGSGDLLAGMTGAFLAQGLSPRDAAGCGVYLHGLAADKTAARLSRHAMLPSEILTDMARILMENGR